MFVLLPKDSGILVSLSPIYEELKRRGFEEEAECVVIEGVPVQFLPVFNPLVEEALEEAYEMDYEGVSTRVVSLEHLLAIMLQTGRGKARQRFSTFIEQGIKIEANKLQEIAKRHKLSDKLKEWQP